MKLSKILSLIYPVLISLIIILAPLEALAQVRDIPTENELYFEYRSTDIVEEPTGPTGIMLPPDNLYLVKVSLKLDEENFLTSDVERYAFDDSADQTIAFTEWQHIGYPELTVRLGGGAWGDTKGNDGWLVSGGVSRKLTPNIQGSVLLQFMNTLADTQAARVDFQVDAVLALTTAGRLNVWFYRDEDDFKATWAEASIAQALTPRLALHGDLRYYDNSFDKSLTIASVYFNAHWMRHTYLRPGYRRFNDSDDVTGQAISLGLEHDFKDEATAGLFVRRYWTNEDVRSNTFGVSFLWKF